MSTPTPSEEPQVTAEKPAVNESVGSGGAAPAPAEAPASEVSAAAPAAVPGAAPALAPAANQPDSPHKLSTFLKVSIILLGALSVASIALVFVGDFEGKVERITATFLIFAVFVGLTAIDTSRGQRNGWYAPVALIANSYILAIMLIVTWMISGSFFLGWEIFWKSVLVIGVTRAVVGCCQLLIGMGEGKPDPLARFAFITSVLAVVSGILFTAPLAIEVFNVEVPELYWKFAVAALLLTALGLAITLLLRWSYGSSERDAARRQREAAMEHTRQNQQHQPSQPLSQQGQQPGLQSQQGEPLGVGTAQPNMQPSTPPSASPNAQPSPGTAAAAPAQSEAQGLLPWPTFPDGRALPVGPDGQPDFSALNR